MVASAAGRSTPYKLLAAASTEVPVHGDSPVGGLGCELNDLGSRVPRMSDLRESGSIEQDADMVGLLYRTAYYAEDAEEKEAEAGKAELVLAKNRNGETGHLPLTFIADLMRFETGAPAREEG